MILEKIFIVAGHGKSGTLTKQNDPGAIATDGTTERALNKAIAEKITGDLVEQIGVSEDLTLTEKIKKVNDYGFDSSNSVLVSIHCNSAGSTARGAEAFYYTGSGESKALAEAVLAKICAVTGLKNRGAKDEATSRYGQLGIVHNTTPLAILVECGFLSNSEDLAILKAKTAEIAQAISAGIEDYASVDSDDSVSELLKKLSVIWYLAERVSKIDYENANSYGKRIMTLAHAVAEKLRGE